MIAYLDLHLHSRHSFDGVMSPRQIVGLAQRRGLAGIAVTDHDTIAGGVEAAEANNKSDFLVIVGAEIKTEVGDLLGLFLHEEIGSRKCDEVIAEVHSQGGLVVVPHPYYHHGPLPVSLLAQCDAVEVYNGRVGGDYSERSFVDFVRPYNLAALGSSDAHLYWEIGRARTRVVIERLDAGSVRDALMRRECQPMQVVPGRSAVAVYFSKLLKHWRRLF